MREYLYSYQSITKFQSCVSSHSWLLRPEPCENTRQTIIKSDVTIFPVSSVSRGKDFFGSTILYGRIGPFHSKFGYISTGIVRIEDSLEKDPSPLVIYRMPSALTVMSDDMKSFLDGMTIPTGDFDKATVICNQVHDAMIYTPQSTGVMTSSSQAFMQRKGVCQDYAHIMIALCRELGLYARYVCGLVCGEGETHAWVEVWHDGSWYPFDPTAGHVEDDQYGYIKIAHGRDASDCPANRGMFTGVTVQETETKVIVEGLN